MNKSFQIVLCNILYVIILMFFVLFFCAWNYISSQIQNHVLQCLILFLDIIIFAGIVVIKIFLFFVIKRTKYFRNLFEDFDKSLKIKLISITSAVMLDVLAMYSISHNLYIENIKTFESFPYIIYSLGGVSFSYISYLMLKKCR